MHKDPLALEVMASDGQHHGDTIQFSQIDTHGMISEADFWELALTPMTLEVTDKSQVAGICKQFAFSTGEPLGPIQQADPIPGRQVMQQPVNVPTELLIQIDSLMEMVSFHACFNHVAKKGSTRSAHMTHEVKLAHQ